MRVWVAVPDKGWYRFLSRRPDLEEINFPAFDIGPIHVDLVNVPFVEFQFLLYGVALVLMMLLRPEGLFPSQRRRAELHVAEELDEGGDPESDAEQPGSAELLT